MDHQLVDVDCIVVFAGEHYREFLMPYLTRRAVTVEIPLEGLRIGNN
jgi:hypothetical protein